MFTVALFILAQNWKQLKYPSATENTHKSWYTHSLGYCKKKSKMYRQLLQTTAWTNLTCRLLSKEARHEKNPFWVQKGQSEICSVKVKRGGCLLKGATWKGQDQSFQSTSNVYILIRVIVTRLCSLCENSLSTYNLCTHFSVYITQKLTLKNIIYQVTKNDDTLEINPIEELCKIYMEKTWQYDYKCHREEKRPRRRRRKS